MGGLGHLRGPVVNLDRIFWVPSIEPFLGQGGVQPSVDLRPPQLKARPPLCDIQRRWFDLGVFSVSQAPQFFSACVRQ